MRNLWLVFVLGLATGYISEKHLVSSQSSSSMTDDLYLEGQSSGNFPIDDEDGEDSGSGSGSGDYLFDDVIDRESVIKKFLVNMSETTLSRETSTYRPRTTDSLYNPLTSAVASQDPPTTAKDTATTPYVFPGKEEEEEVPNINSTADWFTHTTRPSPSEITSTKFSMDVIVTKDAKDSILNEDRRVDLTAKETEREVLTKESQDDLLAKDGHGSKLYNLDSPNEVTSENLWERTEVLAAVIACGVIGFLCAVFLLLLLAYRMKKKDEGSYDLGDTKLSTTAYQKAPTKEFYA